LYQPNSCASDPSMCFWLSTAALFSHEKMN
jgi:hypothetical protein